LELGIKVFHGEEFRRPEMTAPGIIDYDIELTGLAQGSGEALA
jgi:hypothetical protein